MAFLDLTLEGVAANLALDEALLLHAERQVGPAVLRTWEPPEYAVVLGATCPLRTEVRLETCSSDRVVLSRRTSGGGTVLIGPGALNVSIVLPIAAHPALAAVDTAQEFILMRSRQELRRRGAIVDVRGSGDLVLGDRKCSGSAQRRVKGHVLVHATVLHDFDLAKIGRYLGKPRREPTYREGRSHEDFVTNLNLPVQEIKQAFVDAWLGPHGPTRDLDVPWAIVDEVLVERLGRTEWVEKF